MPEIRTLILIPSYNTGARLLIETVTGVLHTGVEILVVIDGSTDGSGGALARASDSPRLNLLQLPVNSGKGNAVRVGAEYAINQGYTHVLVMDADGQHPVESINPMLKMAQEHPGYVVMGQPLFGSEAPKARVYGRRLTSFWTNLETAWCGLGDTLFGMRVYPLPDLLAVFTQTPFARGFDFDPEIAVRLAWRGCFPVQVPVKVRYLSAAEGGVSHFNYLRDNLKLILLHFRLVPEFLVLRAYPFFKRLQKWKSDI